MNKKEREQGISNLEIFKKEKKIDKIEMEL